MVLPPLQHRGLLLQLGALALILGATAAIATLGTSSKDDSTEEQPDASPARGLQCPRRVPYLPSSKLPILGHVLAFARNGGRTIHWFTEILLAQDGEPFALRLPGQHDLVLTAKPEHYEQVAKAQFDNFPRGDHLHDVLGDLLGDSVLVVDGERWKRQRRILVRLFTARTLREYMTPVVQKDTRVLQGILARAAETDKPVDVYKLMKRFTLQMFVEIGLGLELDDVESDLERPFEKAFDNAEHIVVQRLVVPVWFWKLKRWLNMGSERQMHEAMAEIEEFVMSAISKSIEQRSQGQHKPPHGPTDGATAQNLISIILDSLEDDATPVDPVMVRDIVVVAIIAGRDTTADAMSWLLHALDEHPAVERKLRAELLAGLPKLGTSEAYVPSMEDLQGLTYLEATIREALRLFPPVPAYQRVCIRDTVFPDGTFVPAGTNIAIVYYAINRLTSVWGPDAASFRPERFIDDATGELLQVPPINFSAFNTGPRVCVGRSLAMVELKVMTACIVGRFHLTKVPGQVVDFTPGMTLSMKNPLMVRVEVVEFSASATSTQEEPAVSA